MTFKRTRKTHTEDSLYEYAVGALGRRMRTVAEIKWLMRQRIATDQPDAEALVEAVVARLKDHGYLNDTHYASAFSQLRRDNEKFGRMRVTQDLRAKGVHPEVIEKTIAEAYGNTDEERLARDFLQKKRLAKPTDQKQAARIFRLLARAGFKTSTAIKLLKKWNVDEELLTDLESGQAASGE